MAEQKELLAKEAIESAFENFKDYFSSSSTQHVLLEGVEYYEEDHLWLITIGFDIGRVKLSSSPFGIGNQIKEPIREIRYFHINAQSGELVKMTGN